VCQGTRGLSLFYVQVRNDDGHLNSIEVQRLKDKLGTKPVPTAELLLDGTRAWRVNHYCWLLLLGMCGIVILFRFGLSKKDSDSVWNEFGSVQILLLFTTL